ncbi:MAG TPA: aldehyde ferredoxin oxidoreductase family protein [Dissulfurispiraceae bacterium]|nr:aldehyde ferredoxin oxidoreductase family protein [Dissulfurispiraceae bacterium]
MSGYTFRSIHVDLTASTVEIVPTPESLRDEYLGGRGFGVSLLADFMSWSYNSHEMPIIFATGPLVGTASPTSGRMSVVSRSPLTGTIFDCSVGGRFGTMLKRAGYDYIRIVGIAERLVVLEIDGNAVALRDAGSLAMLTVSAAAQMYSSEWSTAFIGPAGERQVRYASIIADRHYAAGRGGLGAVMGAKRLKAIAVRGTAPVQVADAETLTSAREDIMRLLRSSQAVFGEFGLSEFGTAALVDVIHARRMEPTENFRKTVFAGAGAYSGYAMKTRYRAHKTGCSGCPVLCKKIGEAREVIPEYETVSHFGALNANSDLESIIEANSLCNELGMDTITAAATIACYAEHQDRTIPPDEMLQLLREIAERRAGRGNELAEGSLRYALSQGHPELSMSVKGLELPAYDPRGAYGTALAYATSNRGGCHLRAYPISHEVLRRPVATDRFSFEGKARIVKIAEDLNAVVDSLTACKFVFFAVSLEEYARVLSAVTGRHYDVQSLFRIGERIWNAERRMNRATGFSSIDDDLPLRFFTEQGSSGAFVEIRPIDRTEFLRARANYYRIRGYAEELAESQGVR